MWFKILRLMTTASVASATMAQAGISALFENPTMDSGYTGVSYADMAPPMVVSGGPSGNYYQLQPNGVAGLSNTIAFVPSGANTSSIHAEFDFRMTPDANGQSTEGFGFAIYDYVNYGGYIPEDFTQLDVNEEAVTWEQPRWNLAFSVGFDLFDGAFETQKNMITLNADGRRVAANVLGFNINDGLFNRIVLDLENTGDDAVASLSLIRDVYGAAENISVFENEAVLGFNIPGSGLAPTDPTGWAVAFGGRSGGASTAVGIDLDNIRVNADAVPEPSAAMLLILTGGASMVIRRRRTQPV